ncbi:Receptor-type tyrosine-protein phosphatase F, partial [Stylophora pistillata]
MVLCIVFGCGSRSDRDKGIRFYRIPSVATNKGEFEEELTTEPIEKWIKAISRGDTESKDVLNGERVCGKHFVSGKPAPYWHKHDVDWVPTLQLGKKKVCPKLDHDANAKRAVRAKKREQLAVKRQEREAAEKRRKLVESSLPVDQIGFGQPSTPTTEEEENRNEGNEEAFSSHLAAIAFFRKLWKQDLQRFRRDNGGCVEYYLGMESRAIPDDKITASSVKSVSTPPNNGRLNYVSGSSWCAETSDANSYLQIDLQTLHIICAVSTQGNSQANQWVKNYTLQLSTDGTTWTDYTEGGLVKVFEGNDDRNTKVKQIVYGVLTRYLRFRPQTDQGGVCMRTEVFGVKQKPTCNMEAIGLASGGTIPNSSFTATSFYDDRYKPFLGRLNANARGWGPKQRNDPKDYLQIDLLYEHFICAVATQGSKESDEWTREYKINLSLDGAKFFAYNETSIEKLFPGNSNRDSIVKNSLQEFVSAKFIRFQPTQRKVWKVLRVEVYGILLTKVPSKPPTALKLTASSPTSIIASWQLPPVFARHGRIKGFKLFYRKKESGKTAKTSVINNGTRFSRNVSGLERYTEYEFQVLAFTSFGDGPKSTVKTEKTMEDAPSQPPTHFNVIVNSSTSVTASWQPPPEESRHGIIEGFKLHYKKKDSGSATVLTINSRKTSTRVTKLYRYTEYEFQVLAFTSAGDGPNSSAVFRTTMEDAPSEPTSLSFVDVPPSNLHGPRVALSWSKPTEPNGVIKSYTLFYSHGGDAPIKITGIGKDALSRTVDVLGGVSYQFHVRAVTIKPGPNGTITVPTKEYAPSVGPKPASPSQVEKTTFNISWEPLPREKSFGEVILYEVRAIFLEKGNLHKRSVSNSPSANTSTTFVVLSDLELCTKYNVSVRAYTRAGPGPYGKPLQLETSRPEAPEEFKATATGTNQVTLAWKQYDKKEKIEYTVKYTGTKDYNKTFKAVEKSIERIETTTKTVTELIPGTTYVFKVHGSSICGESISKNISVTTHMKAPEAPIPRNVSDVEVSETAVDIFLWPVEQKYGPISAYQVIVLKVADGVEELPDNYDSKLKGASDANKENVNFYIAAEIKNIPLLDKPRKFTVGDGKITEEYVNEELEKGENYIVYERALTKTKKEELKGKARMVAKISIISTTT